jgi:hypothetical protein
VVHRRADATEEAQDDGSNDLFRARTEQIINMKHERVTVDTTVQPKAISFPTDAKLLHAAIKGLNRLARRYGVRLRQSYSRVAQAAAMMAGRYAHAKQFRRHQRRGFPSLARLVQEGLKRDRSTHPMSAVLCEAWYFAKRVTLSLVVEI